MSWDKSHISGPFAIPASFDVNGKPVDYWPEYHLNVSRDVIRAKPALLLFAVKPATPFNVFAGEGQPIAGGRRLTFFLAFRSFLQARNQIPAQFWINDASGDDTPFAGLLLKALRIALDGTRSGDLATKTDDGT